jgi:hypothetical protein
VVQREIGKHASARAEQRRGQDEERVHALAVRGVERVVQLGCGRDLQDRRLEVKLLGGDLQRFELRLGQPSARLVETSVFATGVTVLP